MPDLETTLTIEKDVDPLGEAASGKRPGLEVLLLTGCQDKSYALGLAVTLSGKEVHTVVIGNDYVDSPEYRATPNLSFLNLGGIQQSGARFSVKLLQILRYYGRLIRYVTFASPKLVHILWNSKFEYFDRTLLMLYFKLLGKKVLLTAHNVNRAKRDGEDSLLNRLTLRFQYRLTHCIFAHTKKMKSELVEEFGVKDDAVKVIPFGINGTLPDTELTPEGAKSKLSIGTHDRTILFFGRIVPYKGLECLLAAFEILNARNPNYRLIIAGEPMKGYERYIEEIRKTIDRSAYRNRVVQKLQFIPDEETELYFKAADVLTLPYKEIFQSGVMFVGFAFGLPAIGADVGSFREDITEGETGYVFKPGDAADLARALQTYFDSSLYKELNKKNRQEIQGCMKSRHSWAEVGELTQAVYEKLLQHRA